MKKVSVIVPVFNVDEYLGECLDSIVKQTELPYEVLLIDDGSTDRSLEICQQYATRHKFVNVIHTDNHGVSHARNIGISKAQGDWILFIDGDDVVDRNLISDFSPHLNTENDIAIFGFTYFSEKTPSISIRNSIKPLAKKSHTALMLALFNRDLPQPFDSNRVKISSSARFYRRNWLRSIGLEFPINLKSGEDAVFNLWAISKSKRIVYSENPYYFYRKRNESVTNRYIPEASKNFNDVNRAFRYFVEHMADREYYSKYLDERIVWSLCFACLSDYCHRNNPKSFSQRKSDFENARREVVKSLERVDLSDFSFKKKVFIILIKMNLFQILDLACRIQ